MSRAEFGESMRQDIRILLVEDDVADAAITKRLLKLNHLDRDLILASDSKEAMQALIKSNSEGKIPKLILLDLNLPDISGIDLLKTIKKDERFSKIPVIILTGSNQDQDIQRSYDLGAMSYLVKPISKDAMMLVLEKLFSN
jgi:CheY-like chemotaxis protein